MAAKLTAGIDLMLDKVGLLHREEARARLASHGMREAVVRTVTRLRVLRTSAARLLHLIVRSDREPRRMGLASAKSVASWRTRGGISEGAEVAITLSYGYIRRKTREK